MTFESEKALDSSYVMHTFGRKPVEFVEGSGMILKDSDGKEYLDFLSGIGVCGLGHCHPAIVNAVKDQAEKLIHVSNYFYIENRGEVAKRISDLLNAEEMRGASSGAHVSAAQPASASAEDWKCFFANSGAEANECAIKLARLYAKQRAEKEGSDAHSNPASLIITLVRSFHGRTLATLAATGQRVFHKGFEPIPEGFMPTPINDCESLQEIFDRLGRSICAVMIEPIQGESGVHVCDEEFLKCARRLTKEYGALLIFDEVQCGTYRTGKPFAFQNYEVMPDVVTIAKGIASGIPAAACAARGRFGDVLQPGQHGSTFGGSNIAMAAALATLKEMSSASFTNNIIETGVYLREQLDKIKEVLEVRGLGLMVAVDLKDGIDAPKVVDQALEEGLVINATGPHTLRFLPPLICTVKDVDVFIERLKAALEKQVEAKETQEG